MSETPEQPTPEAASEQTFWYGDTRPPRNGATERLWGIDEAPERLRERIAALRDGTADAG